MGLSPDTQRIANSIAAAALATATAATLPTTALTTTALATAAFAAATLAAASLATTALTAALAAPITAADAVPRQLDADMHAAWLHLHARVWHVRPFLGIDGRVPSERDVA